MTKPSVSRREGFAAHVALQPHDNLLERPYEGEPPAAVADAGPYWSLARDSLTGEYRPGADVGSARAAAASGHLDERGPRVLAVLDEVARSTAASDA
ncbi:hypothetical protein [Saccharothrix australiensis]|uniref:hypothetical protein n=1 Tax=Saccharothrix australiensis TaxID=2072 RepID=UPI000EB12B58|nr:hypothetical protein [Saccharothrix australiensis]